MLRAVHTAATGMEAMQTNLDNVANNLANVNTTAYKKSNAEFQDLYYQTIREPGSQVSADAVSPTGVQVGVGVKTASVHKNFEQGAAKTTGEPLDLLIDGDGFFTVTKENGEPAYTRDGSFKVDAQGRMMSSSGLLISPAITVPPGTASVSIAPTGLVEAKDSEGRTNQIGQIELVNFINPAGLKSVGGNLYQISDASGAPAQGNPGTAGLGMIAQGKLEASNVNVVNEMVNMIQAQRAYEFNSKVMQAADQMLQVSNNVLK
ncbi:MAG: flagellar basal-body rod protein FlgG [Oligoflexia bacterium]|nr:flagellar basal-body rod protein FlgG [Oligoflexia bacterium]